MATRPGTGYWSPATRRVPPRPPRARRDCDPATVAPDRARPDDDRGRVATERRRRPAPATTWPPRSASGSRPGDVAISLGTSGTVFARQRHADGRRHRRGRRVRRRHRPLPPARVHAQRDEGHRRDGPPARRRPRRARALALASRRARAAWCCSRTSTASAHRTCPTAPATLTGLRSDTEPAQLARAAYEGVVCGLLDALDALRDAGVPTDGGRLVVVGGGARSAVYPQCRRPPPTAGRGSPRRPSTSRAVRASRPPPSLTGHEVADVARVGARRTPLVEPDPSVDADAVRGAYRPAPSPHLPRVPEHDRDPHLVQRRLARPPEGETPSWSCSAAAAQPWVPVHAAPRRHDRCDTRPRRPLRAPATSPAACGSTRRRSPRRRPTAGKRVLLEFEGVYRGASVWVNGTLVGHRPYGYSNFAVSIGEHLRYGEDNTITVEATAHDDARWYSGAGIYRDVHLVIGEPVHLALDGVHVTTPEVDDDGAVIAVATVVENDVAGHDDDRRSRPRSSTTPARSSRRDVAPLTVFPGRTETLRQRLFVARPSAVERRRSRRCTRAGRRRCDDDGDELDEESTDVRDPHHRRRRRRAGCASTASRSILRGACIHHDNGVARRRHHRTRRRAPGRAAEGRRVQRDPQRAPPDEPGDARRVRPPRRARDGRDVRHVDRTEDARTTTRTAFPDWWEADVDAMVRKDRNHPVRDPLLASATRSPTPVDRRGPRSVGRIAETDPCARRHPTRHQVDQPAARRAGPELFASLGAGRRGADGPSEETGINTMMAMMEQLPADHPAAPVVDEKHGRVVLLPRRRRLQLHASRATPWIASCTRTA